MSDVIANLTEAALRYEGGESGEKIAKMLGVCRATAFKHLRLKNVAIRVRGGKTKPISEAQMNLILVAVCDEFGVDLRDVLGESRLKHVTHARHVTAWIAYRKFNASFPAVAAAIRRRDHTTIINSVNRIDAKRDASSGYARRLDALAASIEVAR